MPRTARVSVVNAAHHVFQRSLNNRKIFFTDKDYAQYLEILKEKAAQYKADVLAWCLMPTYVQVVLIPRKKDSLSKTMARTHFSYAQYLNRRRNKEGTLWRNRFQSCALDEKTVVEAVKYVECQPVYSKKVRKADKYPWSSAKAHVKGTDALDLLALKVWPSRHYLKKWSAILADTVDEEMRDTIRTYTQTGRPLGNEKWVKSLERKFKRRLHALPVGRPPKE